MSYDKETLRKIFDKTEGRCHICRGKLAFSNHGKRGKRGAWHVDHSKPRAKGGANHLNNYYPAHTRCNEAKGAGSNRVARKAYGHRNAPLSARKRRSNARTGMAVGTLVGMLLPPHIRIPAMIAGGIVGALLGNSHETD